MKHICDYGCGKKGKYKIGKKWCCSKSFNSCPAKKNRKLIPREKPEFCDYGCGQPAIYKFKSGKWCCSKSQNSCPSKKERARINRVGVKNPPAQPIETDELCSFGCGKQAMFIYKNGSFCCMDDWHRCPSSKIKISEKQTEVWSDLDLRKKLSENQRKDLVAVAVPVSEDDNHVCKDCGAKAKFWFKTNDRYCCSDRIERCPIVRDEISERTFNLWIDEEFRQKMKDAQIYDEKRCLNVSLAQKKWYTDNPDKKYERAKGLIQFVKDHAGESLEEKFGEEKGKRIRQKASERVKGKTWVELYGKVKAEEMKSKQSSRLLNKTIVELYGAERASQISLLMSIKKTEHWKNPEYAKKISSTFKHGMNKPEKIINEIIEKLGYIFVGNFDRMINGKNPDFINDNKKKIIEHFGIWYHGERYRSSEYNDFSTNEEHEQQRIDHFAKEGYKCLIIWEDELKDIEKLIEKILKFDME